MKNDGSVITWGNSDMGGDSTAVKNDLACGVQQIYPPLELQLDVVVDIGAAANTERWVRCCWFWTRVGRGTHGTDVTE